MTQLDSVHLEILGDQANDKLCVPQRVRLNGIELPIPADTTITVSEITSKDAVQVTLTMFVERLTIGPELSA